MPSDSPPAIRLERLSKQYGSFAALRDVSLDVHPGEIFGFLGLNGAGKTTTIRILLDLVRPSSGRAFVFGENCRTSGVAARRQVGYLPGELGFYGDLTGEATLDVLGRLTVRVVDKQRQDALLERLQFAPRDLRRKVREYSTGMKRKLGIVQAFQSDAALLILDEPTEGLDPLMQDALYELLIDTRRRGRTIFMSSHVLPEVERVCDRIGLLRQGELVLLSGVEEVRRLAARRVLITFREDVAPPSATSAAGWPAGCEVLDLAARAWSLRVHGPLGPLVSLASSFPIADIEVREAHLEDILKRYYRDEAAS
jgi:beta-exotoxin I transport system ATP-binding protein